MTTPNNTTLASNQATLSGVQLNQVIEQLKEFENSIVVNAYNEYADSNNYEHIYDNDEDTINQVFNNPYDAINRTNNFFYKDIHDYFTFNGYAHAISFDSLNDGCCPIDYNELAQYIIDNDLFSEYDIKVTTLDDMLASIEDNITDDENLLYKLCDYLVINYNNGHDIENLVSDCMYKIEGYCYESLEDIINHLGINYQ